jgi:beta-lactamase superfamily II metal-dependent hydrolase
MKSRQLDPIIAALALLFLSTVALAQHPAKVHFINVGQAESILLEFDKEAVLIDAGGGKTRLMCNKTSTLFNT